MLGSCTWISCALQAVYLLKAERIGHGYHVLEDPELYKELLKAKMHFEVRMVVGGRLPGSCCLSRKSATAAWIFAVRSTAGSPSALQEGNGSWLWIIFGGLVHLHLKPAGFSHKLGCLVEGGSAWELVGGQLSLALSHQ